MRERVGKVVIAGRRAGSSTGRPPRTSWPATVPAEAIEPADQTRVAQVGGGLLASSTGARMLRSDFAR